jgi:outer membrane autotransporter protein
MQANQGSARSSLARTPRLRESARAIRAALLATSALAAFGGALPAFAAGCVLDVDTIHCNGEFETPAPDAALAFAGDDLTVVLGDAEASSVVADGVDGISLFSIAGSASVVNYGDISAIGGGAAQAVEVDAYGDAGFGNYGKLSAEIGTGGGAPYEVTTVDLYSYAGSVFAQNAAGATISASAQAEYGYTLARAVISIGNNAYFSNYGGITVDASAEVGNVVAIGVQTAGAFSTVYNAEDASIVVAAESGQGITYGADAWSAGAFASGTSAYVHNAGTIAAQSYVHGGEGISTAIGSEAYGFYGFATTTNTGTISAHAVDDSDEASYSFAYGVVNQTLFLQSVASANNYGTIEAHAETYFGAAISYGVKNAALYSATNNAEGALIQAISDVAYSGMASAVGTQSYGKYYAHDVNAGTISAYASSAYTEHYGRFTYAASSAIGVIEEAPYVGGVVLENSGTITAAALTRDAADFFLGGASATGVHQNGKYYAGVVNSGDISAYASTDIGVGAAFGIEQRSKYGGTTYVYNGSDASIVAQAQSGSAAGDLYGGRAFADAVRMFSGSYAILYNDGLIAASATVDANDRDYLEYAGGAQAYASYQRGQYGATLRNTGDMLAHAEADHAYASAYGAWMRGYYYAVSYNQGDIIAEAQADYGDAFAVSNYVDSPGQKFYQYCLPYGGGCVYNYYGGQAAIENDSNLYAHATAAGGVARAYGGVVIARLHAQAANRGDILAVAEADGGSAEAVGLLLRSDYGDVWADNAEGASIIAAAYGDEAEASAVLFVSPTYAVLTNAGTIAAMGDGERIAVDGRLTGSTSVSNYGLIAGSILTGDGDDSLYNAEGARIRLAGSTIDLGYSGAYGNTFLNYGTVSANGSGNLVNMGNGPVAPLVPALNPYAFYNYGAISFQDGDTDDSLTIVGDFAGDGSIDVDVSGLHGASDQLYIDGSVASGTVATINVDLIDLPEVGLSIVPIVYVSGDSTAGNFTLGDVDWDGVNSFLTLDFDLVADIDASNATPDVFALGINVTGLSDPGTLAANIPGSVQSLMNSQVGTWRQRMGVIDQFTDGAVSLWARIWTDKGGWNPEHHAGNFGDGGNFDWDQKNSGFEAGVDFSVTDEFSIGLLIGKSEADVDLDDPGHGSADLDADTWGLYGTWISPTGFYLDASYRWMSFDVDMNSVAGAMELDGDAESFNLELGYAWTLSGGLKIEPQFQYTKTNVDSLDVLETSSGMTFHNEGGDSSRGRLGVALRKSFGEADAGWLWTPYVTLSAVREFDGETQYSINDVFHGETTLEGTSTLLELGFTARHQNWSIYGGLNWQDGGAVNNFFGGQLGVRYTFGGPAPVAPPPPPAPPAKTCADLDDDGDGINNCDDTCPGSAAGEAVGANGCPVPPEPVMEPKPFRG